MPTFCRHGRLQANCPICSKSAEPARPARAPRPSRPRATGGARTPKATSGIRVRRVERAPEDGYENWLVHGLRATSDAARLAAELAFAEARLNELRSDPPGPYGEAAQADPQAGIGLAFLIAVVGPGRGGDPWSGVEQARGDLSTAPRGPRAAPDPARASAGFSAWAQRNGGPLAALSGEADWEPVRRFARAFERVPAAGLGRGARFEFLLSLGALGLVALEPGSLFLGSDPTDPVVAAAKRVLGIGDAISLERRAAELARETGVPLAALDLALFNWAAPEDERATMGARAAADPQRTAEIASVLRAGVANDAADV